ncbi:LysR family transcriptional regulator [Tateyamaria sp.]|uniref:LysR family transcriptional regulator n=1 Tax=Tateyamaria sp. TaxID=1929288 RepID=UPI003B220B1F
MKLQHLKYFVAVFEEGSFSAGAQRVNATQSGLSMHVRQLEDRYQVQLLNRSSTGVTPTEVGRRFYRDAVRVLHAATEAEANLRSLSGTVTGHVTVGLMPTFTRALLGPALLRFTEEYPNVKVTVREAYSGELSRQILAGELDFAIVPAFDADIRLRASVMGSDKEYLVVSADSDIGLDGPVRLSDLQQLDLVLPSRENVRRRKIEQYFATNGIESGRIIELDSMFTSLDLVARSDWMTILPGILCLPDLDGRRRRVIPISDPELTVDYLRIESMSVPLSDSGQALYRVLTDELSTVLDQMK